MAVENKFLEIWKEHWDLELDKGNRKIKKIGQ